MTIISALSPAPVDVEKTTHGNLCQGPLTRSERDKASRRVTRCASPVQAEGLDGKYKYIVLGGREAIWVFPKIVVSSNHPS